MQCMKKNKSSLETFGFYYCNFLNAVDFFQLFFVKCWLIQFIPKVYSTPTKRTDFALQPVGFFHDFAIFLQNEECLCALRMQRVSDEFKRPTLTQSWLYNVYMKQRMDAVCVRNSPNSIHRVSVCMYTNIHARLLYLLFCVSFGRFVFN